MADTDPAHHEAEESRKRAAAAEEGLERKRRTRGSSEGVVEGRSKPGISGTRSGKVGDAVSVASVAESLEDVRKKGHLFWNKMTTCRDPYAEVDRFSHTDFLRLPSRKDYPDYYEMIKKPMSFSEIKTKLDRSEYTTIDEMRTDFNQIFVNAKRYNAPGSPIFLDAKRLHKLMKEYYDLLTGEGEMPEEEEPLPLAPPPPPAPIPVPQPVTYVAPRPNKPYNPQPRGPPPPLPPPGVYIKRGPTLKPWLNKKLHEFTNMRDPETGRQLTDDFKSLPDRKAWAEYYKVIMHPLAIDMVTARVTKRYYQSVKQFEEDIHLILSNALFFNEESSRIWKDARILSDHFNNIMKEVPPAFVPPRKYNTAKRRAEEAAIASGAMPAPKKETRGSVGGSEEPEGDFESGEEEFEEAYGSPGGYGGPAPFDLPVGLNGRSREMTPAGGVPFAASSGFGYPAALSLNNQSFQPPPQQYATPSFNQRNSTPLQQQLIYPPVNGNGPLHPPAPAPEPVTAVLVSKMPARHESSQILSFRIDLPSSNSIILTNETVRQHSIVLPSPDTNIEVALHLYQSTPPPIIEIRGKKVKSEMEESLSEPSISCTIRPSAASSTLLEGGARGEKKYVVSTVVGLNILEFVVGQEREEGEVYRIFCTRFS